MPKNSFGPASGRPNHFAVGRLFAVYALLFAAVGLAHATLLHLPYFWDEGGYYVPAALDFYHRWTLIPEFTNAHPPLPNVVLGLLWHVFGVRIVVTRLTACAFAAGGLLALYALGRRLLEFPAAIALTFLTAVYPIWFAQSSLAHADIFAAAFSLGGVAVFLTSPEQTQGNDDVCRDLSSSRRLAWAGLLFCLSVLAKETAIVQPAALAGLELFLALRATACRRRAHLRWLAVLCAPVPVLALWFGYHRWKTGFTFGNPTYLRYNATANFTLAHFARAFEYRFVHIFWQRNIWLPVLLAIACFLLPRRPAREARPLDKAVVRSVLVLIAANWIAFSILGGALLTRYLLPVYALLLLLCVSVWQARTRHWPWLAAFTAGAFISAIWLNPPTYFAPEDNLTYRDMIVVHQEAIRYLEQHYPDATVLTAWPAAAELFRPELGYSDRRFKIFEIENFSRDEIEKAAQQPGRFDTALIFTTHYTSPSFQRYLLTHPESSRGRDYAKQRDLTAQEIAVMLGGHEVWFRNRGGEWAVIIRFDRRYQALVEGASDAFRSSRCTPASAGEPCSLVSSALR